MIFLTQQDGESSTAELVKQTETSAPHFLAHRAQQALKKRIRRMAKKLRAVQKQQQRISREKGLYAVAVTLTYADNRHFDSKHVTRFIDCLRKKLKRVNHSLPYVWVLERASTLHYHFILWLPRGFKLIFADFQKWWPWGSAWCESCKTVTGWRKYLSKKESKVALPRGARLFGCGGLDERGATMVAGVMQPMWLQRTLESGVVARRHKGGGWLTAETGEIHTSPYIWTPRGLLLKS